MILFKNSIVLLSNLWAFLSFIGNCNSAVFFPTNSAYGIFAAIAVPLDLPHRNVFISYNFEANYNLPYTWNLPPVAYGIEDEDLFETAARSCTNCTMDNNDDDDEVTTQSEFDDSSELTGTTAAADNETITTTESQRSERKKTRQSRSLLSRKHFYYILKDKFARHGYKAEECLLRLICETNASDLGDINGILGNLLHIVFSPSTSMNENLPLKYYQAELDGVHEKCEHYADECPENLLDLISMPLIDIVSNIRK